MKTKVKLSDVLDALEFQSDESHYYLDRDTAVVHLVSFEEMSAAEDDDPLDDYPEWQHEAIGIARRLVEGKDESLIELPTRWDVNEYEIMEAFCDRQDEAHRDALNDAIQGKGAFRRFKDTLARLDLFDSWNRFRQARFKLIAIEWCEHNDVAYVDDVKD